MSSNRTSTLAFTFGFTALALTSAGCKVYDAQLLDMDAAETPDASAPMDAPVLMPSRQPPERPPIPADDIFLTPLTYALRNSLLDQGTGWSRIGYDLDGLTTSAATDFATQCTPPGAERPPIDGVDGTDNVFGGRLFPLVNAVVPGLQDTARRAQDQGIGMPIIRISEWNGEPNDSRVDCVVTTAVLSTSADGMGTSPPVVNIVDPRTILLPDGSDAPYPTWDGMDWTWVRNDTFASNDIARPLIRDDNAYVRDNQLVMRLPAGIQLVFPARDLGVSVRLSEAIIVGNLTRAGGLAEITITGRWSVVNLLATAQAVGICAGSTQYNLLESQLNTFADIRSVPPGPGAMNLTCDAVSVAVTFQGSPIRIAGLVTGLDVIDQCANMGDAGVDAGGSDAGVDAFVPPDAFTSPDARSAPDAPDAR
jgi:hypothetical protein